MTDRNQTAGGLHRRAILAAPCRRPAAAIASLPSAAAAEPDPVFAAIAAHERAAEAYTAALQGQNEDEVELAAEADTEAACAMVASRSLICFLRDRTQPERAPESNSRKGFISSRLQCALSRELGSRPAVRTGAAQGAQR